MKLIQKIVERAWEKLEVNYATKLDMLMDISKVHENYPLKLEELLEADNFNFFHDIIGIGNNICRKTGKLDNCFLPRYLQ